MGRSRPKENMINEQQGVSKRLCTTASRLLGPHREQGGSSCCLPGLRRDLASRRQWGSDVQPMLFFLPAFARGDSLKSYCAVMKDPGKFHMHGARFPCVVQVVVAPPVKKQNHIPHLCEQILFLPKTVPLCTPLGPGRLVQCWGGGACRHHHPHISPCRGFKILKS